MKGMALLLLTTATLVFAAGVAALGSAPVRKPVRKPARPAARRPRN